MGYGWSPTGMDGIILNKHACLYMNRALICIHIGGAMGGYGPGPMGGFGGGGYGGGPMGYGGGPMGFGFPQSGFQMREGDWPCAMWVK